MTMDSYRSNRNCGCLRCRFRGILGAVVLMTVGVLFLLENFHVSNLDFEHTWPLILIAVGVVLMLQRSASTEGHVQPLGSVSPFPMPPTTPVSSSQIVTTGSEVRHE
jgi:hypothetical protein